MFEMMYIGTKSLMYSAQEAADEEGETLSSFQIGLTVAIAIVFSLGIFVLLPYALTNFAGLQEDTRPILFNLVDGIFKLAILILYIYLIGLMDDMKRVFQYHGAEHKAVHVYEQTKGFSRKEALNTRRLMGFPNSTGAPKTRLYSVDFSVRGS